MATKCHKAVGLVHVGILCFCLADAARADRWGPPTAEHWSENRQYVLHVAWPEIKKLALFKAGPAGGREEIWSRPYIDLTWAPHVAYVANDGQHVVLRDRHGKLGYGKVLVFLGARGDVIRAYELADLLTESEISAAKHSVSSIWWSQPGWFSFLTGEKQFAFVTHHGIVQCFDVASGNRVEINEAKRVEIRERALGDLIPLLRDQDAWQRAKAATLCGVLKGTQAVPDLKALLSDRAVTGAVMSGVVEAAMGVFGSHNFDYCGVQAAAAQALTATIGKEAVPLIEEQLADATPVTRKALLGAIASLDGGLDEVRRSPDSAFLLATWHRLAESQMPDVRNFAIRAVLARDQAQYVYDNPAIMDHPDDNVRFQAVRCLVERGEKRAIPFLRTALRDSYGPVQTCAFRGLIKYNPDDVLDLLHQGLNDKDRSIQFEALLELVRRGEKEAVDTLADRIARLKNYTRATEDWFTADIDAAVMCRLVAELKLSAVQPALKEAYTNDCKEIRRPVCGALAALGDQDATAQLRKFARVGNALDRCGSIEMLGLIGDTESMPFLSDALRDREPWVREAARKAIDQMKEKKEEVKANKPGGTP